MSECDRDAWVRELRPAPAIEEAFERLARLRGCAFLDSALPHPTLGRYSFLAADPVENWSVPADGRDALGTLSSRLGNWAAPTLPGLPPFQGGAIGVLSYELGRSLERVPAARHDEFAYPALAAGLYDVLLAVDQAEGRAWIVSRGLPEPPGPARRRRAESRGEQLAAWLAGAPGPPAEAPATTDLAPEALAPQFPVEGLAGLTSDYSADNYRAQVARAVEYIRAGDIFQVNLSQRLLHRASRPSPELYLRLRRHNPATFAGYLDLAGAQVLSSSPERFVAVRGRRVETRPIKGTRRRVALPEADLYAAADLRDSLKDRAENVMIVDLLRNDLSRVCLPDSVRVTQLCHLERYAYVQHLVSAVEGELTPGLGPLDLLRAAFPGGSITGAPKVRAMEIIAELEPTARGPYCGALGYLGCDGAADFNILIRTVTASRGWWQLPAGGGIVADSDPHREYEETRDKARGLVGAL